MEFVSFMNNFFDSLNGTYSKISYGDSHESINRKDPIRNNSYHDKF